MSNGAKRSRSIRQADERERKRLRAKTPIDRMAMALRAGRLAAEIAKRKKHASGV